MQARESSSRPRMSIGQQIVLTILLGLVVYATISSDRQARFEARWRNSSHIEYIVMVDSRGFDNSVTDAFLAWIDEELAAARDCKPWFGARKSEFDLIIQRLEDSKAKLLRNRAESDKVPGTKIKADSGS